MAPGRFYPLIDGHKHGLMLWIDGYRHDFSTDAAFDLVVAAAAGHVYLELSARMIATHLVRR